MDMDVTPRLLIKARIRVLYEVIDELAQKFGIEDHSVIETIRKGILIERILQNIYILYLNGEDKAVCKITMTVDWAKHEILARSENGREFTIDISKGSTREQISEVYQDLIDLTEDIRNYYRVQKIKAMYSYRNEVYSDEVRLREARIFLGTSPGDFPKMIEESDVLPLGSEDRSWDVIVRHSDQDMSELETMIEYVKPKKRNNL